MITLLYIIVLLTALVLIICLFALLVPIRYKIEGGYENRLRLNFDLRCSPAFILTGHFDEGEGKPLQARLIICGIPFKTNLQKEKQEKKRKEKKRGRKKSLFSLQAMLGRNFRAKALTLIKDLLAILNPDCFMLQGRIGFDEPHLTGWFLGFAQSLKCCCARYCLNIDPVWDDECYELAFILTGRIRLGPIFLKVGWFMLALKGGQLLGRIKKEEASPAA